jgi:hypothetical protein
MVDTFHSLIIGLVSSVPIVTETSSKANHPAARPLRAEANRFLYVNLDVIVICPNLGLILVFEFFGSKLAPNRCPTLSSTVLCSTMAAQGEDTVVVNKNKRFRKEKRATLAFLFFFFFIFGRRLIVVSWQPGTRTTLTSESHCYCVVLLPTSFTRVHQRR